MYRAHRKSRSTAWITAIVFSVAGLAMAFGVYLYLKYVGGSDGPAVMVTSQDPNGRPMVRTPALEAAEGFLRELSQGQVDRAYDRSTKDFRDRQTLEVFRAQFEEYPALQGHSSPTLTLTEKSTGQATFKGTLYGSGQKISFTLRVLFEDNEWRIDLFHIQ